MEAEGVDSCYARLLKDAGRDVEFAGHVLPLVVRAPVGTNPFFRVPAEALRDGKTHLFFFLPSGEPLGGMSSARFEQKATPTDGKSGLPPVRSIHRCYLDPRALVDPAAYTRERTARRVLPPAASSGRADFCVGVRLRGLAGPYGGRWDPAELVSRRYATLLSVEDNAARFDSDPRNLAVIADETLFAGVASTEERREIDRWSFSFLSAHATRTDEARRWVATQEERLFRFFLDRAPPGEAGLLGALRSEGLLPSLGATDDLAPGLRAECERLFRDRNPTVPSPTVWFAAPALLCLELSLACMRGMAMPLRDGTVHLSHVELRADYLPRLAARCAAEPDPEPEPGSVARSHPTAERRGAEVAAELTSRLRSGRRAARGDPNDPAGLPPIEECENAAHFPLCALLYANALHRDNHLHFPQRQHYSAFLLDSGFGKAEGEAHFRKRFLQGGTSTKQFDAKYRQVFVRNETGKWENGRRTKTYGMGCNSLTTGGHPADGAVGCPFRFADDARLRRELENAAGVRDPAALERILAARRLHPAAACGMLFAELHPGDRRAWRPSTPQQYFRRSLDQRAVKKRPASGDVTATRDACVRNNK